MSRCLTYSITSLIPLFVATWALPVAAKPSTQDLPRPPPAAPSAAPTPTSPATPASAAPAAPATPATPATSGAPATAASPATPTLPAAPPAPASPATAAKPADAASPKSTSWLVFDPSSSEAVIERRQYFATGLGHDSQWITVCTAPCNLRADPDVDYRVGGAGVEPSRSFRVSTSGTTVVRSDVAMTGQKWGGIFLLGAGILAVNVGPSMMLAGAIENGTAERDERGRGDTLVRAGGAVSLVGIAAGIAGLVLFLNNDKTTTQLSWSPQNAGASKRPASLGFTF